MRLSSFIPAAPSQRRDRSLVYQRGSSAAGTRLFAASSVLPLLRDLYPSFRFEVDNSTGIMSHLAALPIKYAVRDVSGITHYY
jgi:hypothetical protein